MNFGYGNKKRKEIIKRYFVEDNEIIIEFLDGSNYKIPFTKENEVDILNKMLEQAIERSESKEYENSENSRNAGISISSMLALFISVGINMNDYEFGENKPLLILGYVSLISFLTAIGITLTVQKELNELKKYSIYLNFKDNFEENCDDPNIFNGVKSKEKELNINTLDNFLLKDIRKINENLNKSKEYKHYITRTRK